MTDALIESIDLHGTLVIGGRTVRIDITTDEFEDDTDELLDADEELGEEESDDDLLEDVEDEAEDAERPPRTSRPRTSRTPRTSGRGRGRRGRRGRARTRMPTTWPRTSPRTPARTTPTTWTRTRPPRPRPSRPRRGSPRRDPRAAAAARATRAADRHPARTAGTPAARRVALQGREERLHAVDVHVGQAPASPGRGGERGVHLEDAVGPADLVGLPVAQPLATPRGTPRCPGSRPSRPARRPGARRRARAASRRQRRPSPWPWSVRAIHARGVDHPLARASRGAPSPTTPTARPPDTTANGQQPARGRRAHAQRPVEAQEAVDGVRVRRWAR